MTLTPRSSTRIKRVEAVPLINGVYTSEVSDDCCGSQLSFRSMKLCGLHVCLFHSTMGLATKPLVPSIEIGVHTLPKPQRSRGHTFTKCRFVRKVNSHKVETIVYVLIAYWRDHLFYYIYQIIIYILSTHGTQPWSLTLTNLSARTKHERPPEGSMTRVSW